MPLSWLDVVDFAAVRDAGYAHALGRIVNAVDYAPVPYSYAPLVFIALSFLHPAGRGFSASARILRSMRLKTASSRASSSFWADDLMTTE
jgi:hypothetical protein